MSAQMLEVSIRNDRGAAPFRKGYVVNVQMTINTIRQAANEYAPPPTPPAKGSVGGQGTGII